MYIMTSLSFITNLRDFPRISTSLLFSSQNESEQLAQQLKTAKVEARVAREEADRARREVLISTSSHFELSKQRDEVLRLTRLVDSLKLELDMTNKRNAEVRQISYLLAIIKQDLIAHCSCNTRKYTVTIDEFHSTRVSFGAASLR